MEKKKFKIPHTFVIIFALIVISALVTFFVPGGEYVKVEQTDQNGITKQALEFRYIDNQPQSWQVLTAFYKGFTRQSGIIVFILVIGAAFWVVNSCKAIDAGILSFLRVIKKLERYRWLNFIGINNELCLRPFTGARRPKKYQIHISALPPPTNTNTL